MDLTTDQGLWGSLIHMPIAITFRLVHLSSRRLNSVVDTNMHVCTCILTVLYMNISFSFHSRCFYSASSSPLLLRGTPDYSIDTVVELTRWSATGNYEWRLAQGPFMAARVGFEPATFQTQGTELTTNPHRPTYVCIHMYMYVRLCLYSFY